MFSVSSPSWCSVASRPESAMKRNAVPAVLGYNWLVRRNKVTMESVRRFGADLHGVLIGASMSTARTAR